jgi:hypothetical protein
MFKDKASITKFVIDNIKLPNDILTKILEFIPKPNIEICADHMSYFLKSKLCIHILLSLKPDVWAMVINSGMCVGVKYTFNCTNYNFKYSGVYGESIGDANDKRRIINELKWAQPRGKNHWSTPQQKIPTKNTKKFNRVGRATKIRG